MQNVKLVTLTLVLTVATVSGIGLNGTYSWRDDPFYQVTFPRKAVAVINVGTGASGLKGYVYLTQMTKDDDVIIEGYIYNFPAPPTPECGTRRGFHIHECGNTLNDDDPCGSMGKHYNPESKNHGAPADIERHVGDLGNITPNSAGVAEFKITDRLVKLWGPTSVIGMGIVIHTTFDDEGKGEQSDSLTTGHAGIRIGCGIIALMC